VPATQIKICGLTTATALEAAIAAGADYAGFMFYPPSPRHSSFALAAELGNRAAGRIGKVGVFVDPDDELLAEAIEAAGLDAVQLHHVTAARRAKIMAQFLKPVWAVTEVRTRGDLAVRGHIGSADRLLYDAKTPAGALPGGMGLTFDWSWLIGLDQPLPWGLAGGLNPENVAEAIRLTGAPLVDTSSGVESAPGVKDPAKIAAFCTAARVT
jgi:phosphoribosylanthranilate isomerase